MNSTTVPDIVDNSYHYHDITSLQTQIILASIKVLVTVFGLVGNTLVIVATCKYTSFSLDRVTIVFIRYHSLHQVRCSQQVTIVFIRHLAIADILFVMVQVLPSATVHIAGYFVLGDTVCTIVGLGRYIPAIADMNFIMILSVYRFLSCYTPIQVTRFVSVSRAHVASLITWLYCSVPTIVFIILGLKGFFEPEIGQCDATIHDMMVEHQYMFYIILAVWLVVPFGVVMLTNISLWVYAAKLTHSINKQACITTGTVSTIFVLTWLPTIAIYACPGDAPVWLNRFSSSVFSINSWLNPIVYVFVNKGFNSYVKDAIKKLTLAVRSALRRVRGEEKREVLVVGENGQFTPLNTLQTVCNDLD